jgi:choline dehydrogenase
LPTYRQLSGIGDPAQLKQNEIDTVAAVPGVGKNLMDRVEISVYYDTKQDWVLFKGCTFGDSVDADPCLKEWSTNGHHGLYSSGPGFWASRHKSDPSLPYLDVFTQWIPAQYKGFYRGYPTDIANNHHGLSAVLLKGHTKSKGWVKLTGSDPQDRVEINKNLFATPDGLKDLYAMREAIKLTRQHVESTPLINDHILQETWPGAAVQTDAQIEQFIRTSGWGHHACCTSKMGPTSGT